MQKKFHMQAFLREYHTSKTHLLHMQENFVSPTSNIILNFLQFHFGKILNCFRSFNNTKAALKA